MPGVAAFVAARILADFSITTHASALQSDHAHPSPTQAHHPTRWIPIGILALALITQQPLLSLTPTGVTLLGTLLIITAYQFLQYYADFDLYDRWHAPANPKSRRRNRRK